MDKYLGRRLDGRYELREIIGVGGMAYVYRAYDTIDDRIVAVKILKDEFLHNEEFSRRFKNESKAIAILSHRNIVRVNDVSFSDSLQYIVMEYIDGITLKEYIEQQKVLKWKEVVHFIVQILQALQHAHDKGIVHQDVKPQNIMLLADGTIKVTDFGIARFSRAAGQQSEQGDKAIGSVHYISPEQARAELTDEKSDLYSVGVMMYEMLTGKLPFESDNAVSVAIMQMQSVAERPTVINPDVPEGLEEITLKAMQKDPAKRYQSAAEMLYDIDEFKNNPSIRFEYKYFSAENDTAHYEEAFNRIRKTDVKSNDHDGKKATKAKPIIPILAGVAGALVVCLFAIFGLPRLINGLQFLDFAQEATPNVEVPNLVGKDYGKDIANNAELSENFDIEIIQKVDAAAVDQVFKQYPLAGKEVKQHSKLTLYVSLGEEQVKIPEILEDDDVKAYSKRLTLLGFKVEEVKEPSKTVKEGDIIRVEPGTGEKIGKGATVQLFISSGKEAVKVPDVIGLEKAQAIQELKDAGLTVVEDDILVENSSYSKNVVCDQSIESDTEVAADTEIVLTVGSGFQDVEVALELPTEIDQEIDVEIYIGSEYFDSYYGIVPSEEETLYFTVEERKSSYKVTVKLSEADEEDYKTYAVFKIDGDDGEITDEEYRTFTIRTTTTTEAPTTTTVATTETTVVTTTTTVETVPPETTTTAAETE